jgi:hypothetical protein
MISLLKKILPFLIIVLLNNNNFIKAQNISLLSQYEDSLNVLGKKILYGKDDVVKYSSNEKFINIFEKALLTEKSFDYAFDSLVTVSRLISSDKKFKLFTWNLPKSDGTFEYFGFIQLYNKKIRQYKLYKLTDKSDEIKQVETQTLDNENWYGALYYKIILTKNKNKRYYTLLAWDGNNLLTSKKIIDVLSFKPNDNPVFGKSIFKFDGKKKYKRIIFEYSSKATMSLKYEKQFLNTKKRKKRKKDMIVFDRISPLNTNLKGQYQFYIPETNIFDGFVFTKGKWEYVKDVDARNPVDDNKKRTKHNVKYNLFPRQ